MHEDIIPHPARRLRSLNEARGRETDGGGDVMPRPSAARTSRFSMRRAVAVWFGAAMVGWVVLAVSAYTAVRVGDSLVALMSAPAPTMIADEAEAMSNIAPAAGR